MCRWYSISSRHHVQLHALSNALQRYKLIAFFANGELNEMTLKGGEKKSMLEEAAVHTVVVLC